MKFAVTILLLVSCVACISAHSNGRSVFGNDTGGMLVSDQTVESTVSKKQTVSFVGVSSKSIIIFFAHVIL